MIRTPEATMLALAPLVGRWTGAGHARFPTIPAFEYAEELRFERDPERPLIHYEQRARQRQINHPAWQSSHWESGFLRPISGGMIELTNAQDNGRVEILRFRVSQRPAGLDVEGTSVGVHNDPRILATARSFELRGDRLIYRVSMATTMVPELTRHLEAALSRVAD